MHASTAERIEQGYREIAERIKIAGRKDPQVDIFELVARWLKKEKKRRWLLILDNADDEAVLSTMQVWVPPTTGSSRVDGQRNPKFLAYLPQSVNGSLLVTTRTRSVAMNLVKPRDVVLVEPMIESDAVALLKKKLGGQASDNHVEELAGTLQYMPLAIVLAGAYIQQQGSRYSLLHYIDEFTENDRRKTSLLDYEAGHLLHDPEATNSIVIAWQISFKYLRKQWPSSADLLSLMSFFDRQGIPKEVLTIQLSDGDQDKKEIDKKSSLEDATLKQSFSDKDIDQLQKYAFISVRMDNETFELHGLVQLATRKWLKMHNEDEGWKVEFYRKLNAILLRGKHRKWSQCERLFPHVIAAEQQRSADTKWRREWAKMLWNAGRYAGRRGDDDKAKRMFERSAQVLR